MLFAYVGTQAMLSTGLASSAYGMQPPKEATSAKRQFSLVACTLQRYVTIMASSTSYAPIQPGG